MRRLHRALNRLGLTAALAAGCLLLPGCRQSDGAARPRTPREDSVYRDSLLQRRKAYEQGREEACKKLYEGESIAYNNVVKYEYDHEVDGCWVIYRYVRPLRPEQCDSMHPPEQEAFMRERLLCHEGQFRTRY
jgi:hypothetical protein